MGVVERNLAEKPMLCFLVMQINAVPDNLIHNPRKHFFRF